MEQRMSLVTLGVADLALARKFYEEVLGWKAAESLPGGHLWEVAHNPFLTVREDGRVTMMKGN